MEILEDVFGIPQSSRTIVEQDGCVNLMKGAIEMADKVTTVSPTYAQEILDPWFSHGPGHHPAGAGMEVDRHPQRHRYRGV